MPLVLNKQRAAMMLIESIYYGDKATVKRYGLSVRTLDNYRRRLNTDTELAELCQQYRLKFEDNWINELPIAAKGIIRKLTDASQNIVIENANDARDLAEALKILAEVIMAKDIIDVQLGRYIATEDEENREDSATLLLLSSSEDSSS